MIVDVQKTFDKYMKLTFKGTDEISENQYTEMRKAFFAGIGIFQTLLMTIASKMTEEDSVAILDDIYKEVNAFWSKEEKNTDILDKLKL